MNKKISVIIPVYNDEEYIARCLESIINQSYKNLEIIVINDGSEDNSKTIIEEYTKKDDRIKLFNQKNLGVSMARNLGLNNASGDYISFIDADDWIELNAYQNLIQDFKEKKVDIIKFNFMQEILGRSKKIKSIITKKEIVLKKDFIKIYNEFIEGYSFANVCNIIFKKDLCKDVNFEEGITCGEDMLFALNIFTKAESVFLDTTPYYHYFVNMNGVTNTSDLTRLKKNIYSVLFSYNKIFEYLIAWNMSTKQYNNKVIERCFKEFSTNLASLAINSNYSNFNKVLQELYDSEYFNVFYDIEKKHIELLLLISNNRKLLFIFYNLKYKLKRKIKIVLFKIYRNFYGR